MDPTDRPRSDGTASSWQIRDRVLHFGQGPLLMGIVNVTPDSFSDGGSWWDPELAIQRGLQLVADGADLLDIGGESTRPGSQPVDENEELRRVIPVLRELARATTVPISIDTSKASVAAAAVQAGASIINDVTGFSGDPEMPATARSSGAGLCLMHMRGTPQTMQDNPVYSDVSGEVLEYLLQRRNSLVQEGIDAARICLDPGLGFGKTHDHNRQLLREITRFHEAGAPLLVGHSRKGFIGKITGPDLDARDAGTLGISLHLALSGVQILRLHEVAATRQALRCLHAVRPGGTPFCYPWPRPAASVDLVIRRQKPAGVHWILLIQRRHAPFAGAWALPGGFVDPGETLETAAARELLEETGVHTAGLKLVGCWSEPRRDPRGRVISTVFTAEVDPETAFSAADDAMEARWFPVGSLPPLAFDHASMIDAALA